MKRSLFSSVLQERNTGNRIFRKGELKGEKRGDNVLKTTSSGGVFR
jgi:hypothetical protein